MRAVILCGGKGTRLRPYTTVLPKPLMPIGEMPILEIVMRQLKHAGITRITLAVGYLAELLEAFFRDGSRIGVPIDYSIESQPLGTVGPLTLIEGLDQPFLMMNGDVLTDLDYSDVLRYHRACGGVATIASYKREVKIDFGVIRTNDANAITEYIEKPSYEYQVSMGIYVFQPAVLKLLKHNERLDFPELVQLLIARGEKVVSYPFSGYWLDMGRPDDYERAIEEFENRKHEFLRD